MNELRVSTGGEGVRWVGTRSAGSSGGCANDDGRTPRDRGRAGAPQSQIRVVGMGAARSTPDFRPMQLMNMALGGNFASRINMNLREKNGYSYGTYSQFVFRRSGGLFQVSGGVRTDVTAPAVNEVMNELQGILKNPISADELARAKDGLANSLPGAFETSGNAVGNFSNVFTYDLGLDYATRRRSVP